MIVADEALKKTIADIKLHEKYERYPYYDTNGHLTIGYGLNLETTGMSEATATFSLQEELNFHLNELNNNLVFFKSLNDVRKLVMAEMSYNLGFKNLCQFEKMFRALAMKNYNLAADEMLDSLWHKQVGKRAEVLADAMRIG